VILSAVGAGWPCKPLIAQPNRPYTPSLWICLTALWRTRTRTPLCDLCSISTFSSHALSRISRDPITSNWTSTVVCRDQKDADGDSRRTTSTKKPPGQWSPGKSMRAVLSEKGQNGGSGGLGSHMPSRL